MMLRSCWYFQLSGIQNTSDKKKLARQNALLNKLLNLNWEGLGPLVEHVLLNAIIFMTKQKSPKQIFERLFTAKNIAGGNVPCFFHLGQVT